MFNPLQSRTLKIECNALPTWGGDDILIPQRVKGVEALGELFKYEVDFASVDSPTFRIWNARKLLKPDELIGKPIEIQVEFEGIQAHQPRLGRLVRFFSSPATSTRSMAIVLSLKST